MSYRNKRSSYDLPSQVFHWLTAVAVTVAFILGPGGFHRLMRQGIDPATRGTPKSNTTPPPWVFRVNILIHKSM